MFVFLPGIVGWSRTGIMSELHRRNSICLWIETHGNEFPQIHLLVLTFFFPPFAVLYEFLVSRVGRIYF